MKLVLRVVMELLSFLRYRREMGEARLCWGLGKAPRLPRAGSVTIDHHIHGSRPDGSYAHSFSPSPLGFTLELNAFFSRVGLGVYIGGLCC